MMCEWYRKKTSMIMRRRTLFKEKDLNFYAWDNDDNQYNIIFIIYSSILILYLIYDTHGIDYRWWNRKWYIVLRVKWYLTFDRLPDSY